MLSVLVLTALFLTLLALMTRFRAAWIRYAVMFTFTLLVVEAAVLGYFLVQIQRGSCFYLIGQDKLLDSLIKMRMSYAVYFAQGKKTFINRVDDDLGYSLGRDKAVWVYRTNRQGFRGDREYAPFPDDRHLRIAAMGDSFVFCDGESNADAWPNVLEHMAGNLEVLNFGVPGYGLGQSYLRYLKYAREYHPDIVFINYVTLTRRDKFAREDIVGGDNLRMADFYRVHFWIENGVLMSRAMSPYDLFDPDFRREFLYDGRDLLARFHLGFLGGLSFSNTGLLIKSMVLRRLIGSGKVPLLYSKEGDDALQYKILSDWLRVVKQDGSHIIFFFESDFDKLPEDIRRLFEANKSFVTYVNSAPAITAQIREHGAEKHPLHNSSAHYNAEGNRYYAAAVYKVLASRPWCRGKQCFSLP